MSTATATKTRAQKGERVIVTQTSNGHKAGDTVTTKYVGDSGIDVLEGYSIVGTVEDPGYRRFKVGDRVRVLGDKGNTAHQFDPGTVGTIKLVGGDHRSYDVGTDTGRFWWVGQQDVEFVSEPEVQESDQPDPSVETRHLDFHPALLTIVKIATGNPDHVDQNAHKLDAMCAYYYPDTGNRCIVGQFAHEIWGIPDEELQGIMGSAGLLIRDLHIEADFPTRELLSTIQVYQDRGNSWLQAAIGALDSLVQREGVFTVEVVQALKFALDHVLQFDALRTIKDTEVAV